MLRDLIIASLLVLTAIALHLSDGKIAVVLLIAVILNAGLGGIEHRPSLLLQGELKQLAVGLARALLVIATVLLLAAGWQVISWHDAGTTSLLIYSALIPCSLMFGLHFARPTSKSKLGVHNLVKIMRGALTAIAGKLSIVLFSLACLALLRTAPAITVNQLVAIDLVALGLPLVALGRDKRGSHKLKTLSTADLRCQLFSLRAASGIAGFGTAAAVLAYGNFWLFFVRHGLSPASLDPSLPLYHQATTLTFVTLAFCLCAGLIFERADAHDHIFTDYLWSNERLLIAFGLVILLMVSIVYVPWLQFLFSSISLDLVDWLTALLGVVLYSTFRLLQRHTRKHTRRAVLKLHHEIHT